MIPQRYAKSLLLSAKETGKLEKILEDVKKLELIFKDENIKRSLISPVTSKKSKIELVETLAEKHELLDITTNFLKLLVMKRRLNIIDDIISFFHVYYQKEIGIEKAILVTADELEDEKLKAIKDKLEELLGKKIDLEVRQDKSMLLGIEIIGRDWRISYSARDMLKNFLNLEI